MVRGARKIIWAERAKQDRLDILEYWKNRNKSTVYSKKLNNLLNEKLKQISENPFIGRLTSKENFRAVLVRDCLILYLITPREIIVTGIWEAHQNPESFSY